MNPQVALMPILAMCLALIGYQALQTGYELLSVSAGGTAQGLGSVGDDHKVACHHDPS
jgi:hypothetical protein